MANSSKDKEINAIDPLFTVGSSPPADRNEELFHPENKGAMGSRVRLTNASFRQNDRGNGN